MYSKGDKILNPKTKRYVSVGSQIWKKLVSEGIFDGAYKNNKDEKEKVTETKELDTSDDDIDVIEKQLTEILKHEKKETKKTVGRPKKAKYLASKSMSSDSEPSNQSDPSD